MMEERNPPDGQVSRNRWFSRTRALVVFLVGALAALTQCSRVQVKNPLEGAASDRVWPESGDRPRVRFLANVSTPDDFFVRRKWLGLSDLLAGREDRSFNVPFDLHLTDDELLLVTDPGKACVHFIDLRQHRYTEVCSIGRQELEQPIGVTADGNGHVYVSDSSIGNVFVFNKQGDFVRPFVAPGELQRPADLVYSPQTGLLYVADVVAHKVQVFQPDGKYVRSVGHRGTEPDALNFPTHVWVDRNGVLYVTSSMDFAIKIFDASGQFLTSFGQHGDTPGFFSRPKGVATDRAGHIYVVDAIFDNVQIFDRGGSLLLTVAESGSAAGELYLPAGVFIDSRNRIFVADQQNHRIAVFQYLEVGSQ